MASRYRPAAASLRPDIFTPEEEYTPPESTPPAAALSLAPAPAAPQLSTPSGNYWVTETQTAAQRYGVDPAILTAMIRIESGFNPSARNPSGASGIAQFMPATAAAYGIDPLNPTEALDGAARYMRDLLAMFGGNYRAAVASYNYGQGNVQRLMRTYGDQWEAYLPAETVKYLRLALGGPTSSGSAAPDLIDLAATFDNTAAPMPTASSTGAAYNPDLTPEAILSRYEGTDRAFLQEVYDASRDEGLTAGEILARLQEAERELGGNVRAVGPMARDYSPTNPLSLLEASGAPFEIAGEAAATLADPAIRQLPGPAEAPVRRAIEIAPGFAVGPGRIAGSAARRAGALAGTVAAGEATEEVGLGRVGELPGAVVTGALAQGIRRPVLSVAEEGAEDALTSARRKILAAADEESTLRESGVVEEEIRAGRRAQAEAIGDVAAGPGGTLEEVGQQARQAAYRGGSLRESFISPIEITDAEDRALANEIRRQLAEGKIDRFEFLRLVAGDTRRGERSIMEKLTSERPNFRPNEIALLRKVFGDEIADAAAKRSARVTAQDLSQAVNDPGVVQGLGHERIEFPGEGRLRGSPEGRQGELTLGGKPSDSPDFVPPPPGGFKTEPLYPEGIPAPKGYTGGVEAKPATGPVTRSPEELVLQSPGYQVGDIKQPAGRLATRSAPSGPISGPMSEQARAQLRQARLNEARRRRLAIQAAAVADEPYQFNLLNEVLGILGLSRSIMATADVSAIGRQAQILGWSNPREWRNAATAGVKAFASQEAADIADDAIRASPWYSIDGGARKGFGFLDVGGKLYEYGGRVKDPGERVPGFTGINNSWFGRTSGKFAPIRASERAHATILNVQGMQVYEKMADAMWNAGIRDRKRYEALAQVINHARGYGRVNIGQIIHGFDVFFSGRLLSSRFDILLDPLLYARQPEARNLALRNLAAFASGQAALMGFLGVTGAMAGGLWSVNADPRSGDFGKLRIGNTTIDLSAGIAPLVRTFTRIGAEGVAALGGPDYTRWQDNWRSTLVGFFRNKEAPWPALATDIIANEDPTGKTVDLSAEGLAGRLIEMHVPFIASSVYESFDQNTGDPLSKSTIATIGAIAEVFGGGTQTYRRLGEERQQALETEALPSLIEARVLPPDATLDNLGSGEYDAAVRWLRQHNPELLDAFEADRRSRNSLFQRIQDRRDVIDREYGAAFDRAYNDLLQGTRKPEEIRETLKGLRSEYAGRLEELYSDPEYRKQVESLEKNDIRKLEDDWYRITEDVAAGRKFPELTSDDWDEIDRRQQAFLDRLPNSTRARFERNLELRDSVADTHPLLKLKREVDEASVEYYELPEAQRDAWLRSHPQENVARWVMYGNQLRSSEAVNLVLSRQAPGLVGDALQQIGPREVKHERLARPINENDGSLAAWQYSQRALDFYFNDAITVFGDREAQRLYKKPFSQITPAQQASVRNIINTNIREANPELDAWLNWWGATETLQTVNAANILRQIVQRYGGTPPKEGHQPRLAADAR